MVLKLLVLAGGTGTVAAAAEGGGISGEFYGFAGILLTAIGAIWAANRSSKSSDRGTALGEAKSLWERNDLLEKRIRKYEALLLLHETDRASHGHPPIPRPDGLYDSS